MYRRVLQCKNRRKGRKTASDKNCLVRMCQSLQQFSYRCIQGTNRCIQGTWLCLANIWNKWAMYLWYRVKFGIALWMTVDMVLDGFQSEKYYTNSGFWNATWVNDTRPICALVTDENIDCKLRLSGWYFAGSLASWIIPPFIYATALTWMKFQVNICNS